jgi:hypothetical protein
MKRAFMVGLMWFLRSLFAIPFVVLMTMPFWFYWMEGGWKVGLGMGLTTYAAVATIIGLIALHIWLSDKTRR